MAEGASEARFQRFRPSGDSEPIARAVPIEAPIAIEYNGIGYAVMMATPVDLEDFGIGFSLSEGLIETASQIEDIAAHPAEQGWLLRIQIATEAMDRVTQRARARVSESSCGLCGMDNLDEVMRPLVPVSARRDIAEQAIFAALNELRNHQPLNAATGAAHAAAFCAPVGTILLVREDVGRHNALDKLLGAMARAEMQAADGFLLLSARCSFELVQKAVIANCPLLVTISAPTSLAVAEARKYGLRLVTLARADSYLLSEPGSKE